MTSISVLHNFVRILALLGAAVPAAILAEDREYEFGGHVKGRLLGQTYPGDSLFRLLGDSSSLDAGSDLRLKFEARHDNWSFAADYQLIGSYVERLAQVTFLPGEAANILPSDKHRLFDLTWQIDDDPKFYALHRLDRLWFGYANDKAVIRFGRQALTWGNGLVFSPMDLVNPFDPATVDTEYKMGDDMLYAQYLRDNGHDIQFAWVIRRNIASGDVEFDETTVAAKYHGVTGRAEYDILVASTYGDLTLAIGGNRSIGGAVWRGDAVVTDTQSGSKVQLVTSLSYSWTWGGKNISGIVEYFFDDFGLNADRYSLTDLANTEILQRNLRGQSFTLGRHYLAGGVTIEMTPLWTLSPTLFMNVTDPSALLQIVTRYNLDENMEFLGALNVPLGPNGSEYGGIGLDSTGFLYLSTDAGLFAQLAWYF